MIFKENKKDFISSNSTKIFAYEMASQSTVLKNVIKGGKIHGVTHFFRCRKKLLLMQIIEKYAIAFLYVHNYQFQAKCLKMPLTVK